MASSAGLFDYHTQTIEHGLDKPRRVRETIEAAMAAGLSSICLTDHYPLPPGFVDPTPDKDCAMPAADYASYQREVDAAIAEFGGNINILRGSEVDWLPEHQDWTKEQIETHRFDYVLGSVHFLGEVADEEGRRNLIIDYDMEHFRRGARYLGGLRALVETYYAQVRALVASGLFDGVGHLDLVKKFNDGEMFNEGELWFDENEAWYKAEIADTLDSIASSGMSMEVNTAGIVKPCNQVYPSPWVIAAAKTRGIPLTIGSDAHKPSDIGKNLDKAVQAAKRAGYDQLVEYRTRRQITVGI